MSPFQGVTTDHLFDFVVFDLSVDFGVLDPWKLQNEN